MPILKRVPIQLERVNHLPEEIAERLKMEMKNGGCIAVLLNRVARSQAIYQAIKAAKIVPDGDLKLFHARFPMAWRDQREKEVLFHAGKKGKRDRPLIVVATQVIEQSLDLDFDLIISDLAPIDLLIQRVGRLHRHVELRRESRPSLMETPRLILIEPEKLGEVPNFGLDERVYERYVLLRTWLELQGKDALNLPTQTRELIELVYTEELMANQSELIRFTANQQQELLSSWEKMREQAGIERKQAQNRIIGLPTNDLISKDNMGLSEDESPKAQAGLYAMTRLCLPSVQIVCLLMNEAGVDVLLDEPSQPVNLDEKPDDKLAQKLIKHAVTITRRQVYDYFVTHAIPKGWQEHAILKNFHKAVFKEEGKNEYVCILRNGLILRLTRERGVEIE